MRDLSARHPSTQQIAKRFAYDHLKPGVIRSTSARCEELADAMIGALPDDPELTAGLRKLREAKDCFVSLAAEVDARGPVQ